MNKRLGKYEILRSLGHGGMGTVYLARDTVLDREVALKTILPDHRDEADSRKRFFQEAKVIARLQHPHLVTLFDFGEDAGVNYLAMEFVPGMDLEEALGRNLLGPHQVVEALAQVCEGLAEAHGKGVVHRDIKPSNIRVFGVHGRLAVKVLDFGLARSLGDPLLTQSRSVVGTPYYIAPEVLKGAEPDPRADIWAVGVILYQALSGCRPFEASTPASIHFKIVYEPMLPLGACHPPFREEVLPILGKALQKEPGDRFQDALALAQALRGIAGFDPLAGCEVPRGEPRGLPGPDGELPTQFMAPSGDGLTTPLQAIASLQVPAFEPLPGPPPPPSPLDLLRGAAEGGDPAAMTALGLRCLMGDGVPLDPAAAAAWFRRGAQAGAPDAMLNLGNLLLAGPGTEAEGLTWIAAAAEAGLAEARATLGVARLAQEGPTPRVLADLAEGVAAGFPAAIAALGRHLAGTPLEALSPEQADCLLRAADLNEPACQLAAGQLAWSRGRTEEALAWFERASARGVHDAETAAAGLLVAAGREPEALDWFRRAARRGSIPAQLALAKALLRTDSGRAQALSLLKQAAAEGNAEAMHLRACLMLEEPAHRQDLPVTLNLLLHAAQLGHAPAMLMYGEALADGWSGAPDPVQGAAWIQRAAEAGLPEALWSLGNRLLQGHGVPKDPRQGRVLLQRAAQAGVPEAMFEMGRLVGESEAGRRDPALALPWFQRAAEAGLAEAMHQVGTAHCEGRGAPRDPAAGFGWLLRAAEAGHRPSMLKVARLLGAGEGTRKDPAQARVWEGRAAAGGPQGRWPFTRRG